VLQARAAALGPLAHYLLEVEWPELYRRAERLRAAGLSNVPAEQAATWRELARRRTHTKEQIRRHRRPVVPR